MFLLRKALDAQGTPYLLDVLSDGEEALRFVREDARAISNRCLFVLDLHLPKYDGIMVLKAIRETPALSSLQVAVLTGGFLSPQQETELLSFNVRLIMKKPMDLDEYSVLAEQIMLICGDQLACGAA